MNDSSQGRDDPPRRSTRTLDKLHAQREQGERGANPPPRDVAGCPPGPLRTLAMSSLNAVEAAAQAATAGGASVSAPGATDLAGAAGGSWVEPGTVLGSYRVIEQLGAGGMGQVFAAEHVRLPRRVAIKVLKPEIVYREGVVERLFAEAQAVNEIGHPNIIEIVDFVEQTDRTPPLVYVVMELLEGEDLAARLEREKRLDLETTLWIADRVLEALEAAHDSNHLHRDIKPENIFLSRARDGRIAVKLLDFGLTTTFGEEPREDRLTMPGMTLGTPEYMAPEQVLAEPLDGRADIYSVGVVLYEMLAGSRPFAARTLRDVLLQQVRDTPLSLNSHLPDDPVPEAVEAVVMACLAKEPSERFQSAGELRLALRGAAAASHTSAGAAGPVARNDAVGSDALGRQEQPAGHDAGEAARDDDTQLPQPASLLGDEALGPVVVPRVLTPRRGAALAIVLAVLAGGILVWQLAGSEQGAPAEPAAQTPARAGSEGEPAGAKGDRAAGASSMERSAPVAVADGDGPSAATPPKGSGAGPGVGGPKAATAPDARAGAGTHRGSRRSRRTRPRAAARRSRARQTSARRQPAKRRPANRSSTGRGSQAKPKPTASGEPKETIDPYAGKPKREPEQTIDPYR